MQDCSSHLHLLCCEVGFVYHFGAWKFYQSIFSVGSVVEPHGASWRSG